MEAAIVLLREKGMASAAKRAGRETTEGKVGYRLAPDGSKGTMVAVGCETEPVSNNDEFLAYAKKVLDVVEAKGVGAESELDEERVEQEWIHDSSKSVGQALQDAGAEVLEFELFALSAR